MVSAAQEEEKDIPWKVTLSLLKSLRLYHAARTVRRSLAYYSPWHTLQRNKAARFYAQFVRSGDLCFDIGANVGEKAAALLALGARVVCVEPQPFCLRRLDRLFARNPNAIIVPKAAADREGQATLAICEDAPSIATMSEEWIRKSRFARDHRWTTTREVPATTLDALIGEYGLPVFCKIDVEGFEGAVLRGLSQPIPLISFEFSRELAGRAEECVDQLLTLGALELNFSIGESMELLFPEWVSPNDLFERLGFVKDELLQGDVYARFKQKPDR